MCGIAGHTGAPRPALLDEMLSRLEHRGPDDLGKHVGAEISFGARRLAIIDVEHGHQPTTNETGSVVAVLNGEIYNHRELRALLERKGHAFRSRVDTEVLPHLYEEFGAGFVSLLRGMFAIAVWDEERSLLLLARDRAGEKPLLFAETPRCLVFASELKALLADQSISREIDQTALAQYLRLQYVPGGQSMLAGVRRLPAGHRLVHVDGQTRIERYWDLVPGEDAHFRSRDGCIEELRERLLDAVGAQMHADVPIGALLSGGVDSAGIVGLMRAADPDGDIRTFTVGFDERGFDEREPARHVASALRTTHTELVVRAPDADDLMRFSWFLDEPVADPAALATYLIAQVASEHVKVVLTGEGSDELFGGYPRYRWYRAATSIPPNRYLGRATEAVGSVLPGRRLDLMLSAREPIARHVAWTAVFDEPEIALLVPGSSRGVVEQAFDELTAGWSRRSPVERAMAMDFKTWLVDDILTKADRMSMAASIEARAPYLDQRVVEFIATIPARERLRGRETKPLLRDALRGFVPAGALERKKSSFRLPVEEWLRSRFASTVRELLLDRDARTAALLRRDQVERTLAEAAGRKVWTLAVLELWLRNLDEPAARTLAA